MQRNIFKVLAVVFLVLFCISQTVFADIGDEEAPFFLGEPVFEGNGCPEGSYSVILTPDSIIYIFSSLTAMTDEQNIYAFSNCNILVPIEVPAGVAIGLAGADYRGLAYIPTGGTGMLYQEYFFEGAQGPTVVSTIDVFDQYYEFFYEDDLEFVTWAECGHDAIAHFKLTVFVSRPIDGTAEAFMSLFPEGWNLSRDVHLKWEYCTEDDDSDLLELE